MCILIAQVFRTMTRRQLPKRKDAIRSAKVMPTTETLILNIFHRNFVFCS